MAPIWWFSPVSHHLTDGLSFPWVDVSFPDGIIARTASPVDRGAHACPCRARDIPCGGRRRSFSRCNDRSNRNRSSRRGTRVSDRGQPRCTSRRHDRRPVCGPQHFSGRNRSGTCSPRGCPKGRARIQGAEASQHTGRERGAPPALCRCDHDHDHGKHGAAGPAGALGARRLGDSVQRVRERVHVCAAAAPLPRVRTALLRRLHAADL